MDEISWLLQCMVHRRRGVMRNRRKCQAETKQIRRCVGIGSIATMVIISCICIPKASCFSIVSFVIPSSVRIKNNPNIGSRRIAPQPTMRYMSAGTATGEGSEWMGSRGQQRRKRRKKYERKRPKTKSEEESERLRRSRQAEYEEVMKRSGGGGESGGERGTLWSFETLFPEPVLDEDTIQRDLFEVAERDKKMTGLGGASSEAQRGKAQPKPAAGKDSYGLGDTVDALLEPANIFGPPELQADPRLLSPPSANTTALAPSASSPSNTTAKVNRPLTRLVEDRLYGFRRTESGQFEYSTSLLTSQSAVKFRDGVRLGNPLRVNSDRLTYFARKELSRGRLEEAEELYEEAVGIDPRDGRAYLGLSRIAQRRRDFQRARECLLAGIENSATKPETHLLTGNPTYDHGANPFLLQAMGCLEEKMGNLAAAEKYLLAATKSRPSHAAAWISLAQLRTRKLRQGPDAGRRCYRTAERELVEVGKPPSSHVYTAWAALEWKAGDIFKARKLFRAALKIDPKCSAAWLQLGVMEAERENWDAAKECFTTVLKFDQRNTRVMQAYALMESKRPNGNSRHVIGLFETALKANPRDAGVLQAYALYVVKLGDIAAARELLRKGTIVNKRHAAVWQAWGVLETRHGKPEKARDIFQQGIWACAQPSGGQSGGRRCARLWQAWGVLESREDDHAAARRCFSRALDADGRNVAAVTAWTRMEKNLGNYADARIIFERALKQFTTPTDEKVVLWQAYEAMESEAGNTQKAQSVYQRSIRDAFEIQDEFITDSNSNIFETDSDPTSTATNKAGDDGLGNQVEVSRWDKKRTDPTFGQNEVWLNDGSIEGKVPPSTMKKKKQ